ncbi:MAG: hypothetical protein ACTSO5_12930 [Candidatus Heimdallarchaeaceae archaeon]
MLGEYSPIAWFAGARLPVPQLVTLEPRSTLRNCRNDAGVHEHSLPSYHQSCST